MGIEWTAIVIPARKIVPGQKRMPQKLKDMECKHKNNTWKTFKKKKNKTKKHTKNISIWFIIYLILKSSFSLSDWYSLKMWLGGNHIRSLSLIKPNKLQYTGAIPGERKKVVFLICQDWVKSCTYLRVQAVLFLHFKWLKLTLLYVIHLVRFILYSDMNNEEPPVSNSN